MPIKDNFVHLHLHSSYSFTDGYGLPSQYISRTIAIGQPGLGVTDHGNISAHYKWYKQCNKAGIKPILGIEFYLVENEAGLKERRYNHITVLVKNNTGYKNLTTLVTKSWCEQYYYKPRITFKDLFDHQEGLIVLSGCLSSPITKRLADNDIKGADAMIELFNNNCDDFYLEVQPVSFEDGLPAYKRLLKLYNEKWKDKGLKIVATNDCHYVCKEQHKIQEILLCVQTNDKIDNPDHWKFDQEDFYLKTRKEMEDSLQILHPDFDFTESLDETLKIAEMVDFTFPTAKPIKFPMEESLKIDYLRKLCYEGMVKRGLSGENKFNLEGITEKQYIDRLEYEIDLIIKKDFIDYFLVITDLIQWSKKNEILVGPARGSAAGSLACYVLEITEVEPIRWGLIFERFIDLNREDLPDIDIDFEDVRRHEAKEYLENKYGKDKVGNLITFSTFKGKSAIDDIGRTFKIPFSVLDKVKNAIIERSGGDSRASFTLEDTFTSDVFEYPKIAMKEYPALHYAIELEGQWRQMCISGDTKLKMIRGETTIKRLSEMKPSHRNREIKSMNKNGELVFVKTKDIWCNGKKQLYRLKTFDGYSIKTTDNHPFFTLYGYKMLKDIKVGDLVATNGIFIKGRTPWNKEKKGSQIAWNKGLNKKLHPSINKQSIQMIGNKNSKGVIRNENSIYSFTKRVFDKFGRICSICKSQKNVVAHHIDHKRIDNRTENGVPLCKRCHSKEHKLAPKKAKEYMKWSIVKSIKIDKIEDVYDIEMEMNENFVANGFIVHNSQHAAGVVISNEPLTDFCAIYKVKDQQVISMDYKDCTDTGLLKIDILGLNTLSVVSLALRMIKERTGKEIDIYTLKLDDPKVYNWFCKGKLFGIFQFDGQAVNQVCRQILPKDFESLSAISALARPGPLNSGNTTKYISRRNGREKITHVHPIMKGITGDSYGIVIYQEQVMRVMREIGKMSWKDTSDIRKNMSRSTGVEKFNTFRDKFIPGALENGLTQKQADDIWEEMCSYGSWAFNKSHSVSYTVISYWTMWLKVHYPMEFYSSIMALTHAEDKKKKILKEYLREGFKILPVDVNRSKEHFSIDDTFLRIGFEDVKGIGETKSGRLVNNQPYSSYTEFVKKSKLNQTTVKNLVDLGAFDSIGNASVQNTLFGEEIKEYEKEEMSIAKRLSICPWDVDFGIEKNWLPFIREHLDYFKKEPVSIESLKEMEGPEDVIIYGVTYDKNLRDTREVSLSRGKEIDPNKYKIVHFINKECIKDFRGQEWTSQGELKKYNDRGGTLLKQGTDYLIEDQFQFANFVIEDDTDFITVRLSQVMFPMYGKLLFEKVGAGDPVVIKGKMGSGIRMFFANKILSLKEYKEKIDKEKYEK